MAGLEVEDVDDARHLRAHGRRTDRRPRAAPARRQADGVHRGQRLKWRCFASSRARRISKPGCASPWRFPGRSSPTAPPSSRRRSAESSRPACSCSERELGVSDDHRGVMALGAEAHARHRASATLLGTADVVLEVAVTPNRGDCLSVVGIAREVAALTGARLRVPAARLAEKARRFRRERSRRDPRPGRLPALRGSRRPRREDRPLRRSGCAAASSALGMRPINNVVDVTNYVMLERGQPLHAFDLARLAGGVIVVRRARGPASVVRTLDGVERSLEPDDLVIADAARPVALAGVMGGAASAVSGETTDVLLEAAYFEPGGDSADLAAARAAQRGVAPFRARGRRRRSGTGRSIAPPSSSRRSRAARSPRGASTPTRIRRLRSTCWCAANGRTGCSAPRSRLPRSGNSCAACLPG